MSEKGNLPDEHDRVIPEGACAIIFHATEDDMAGATLVFPKGGVKTDEVMPLHVMLMMEAMQTIMGGDLSAKDADIDNTPDDKKA